MKYIAGTILIAVGGICAFIVISAYLHRRQFPYGWDHCCDKQLGLALVSYAQENGGKFPSGGPTPEASLSLLYPKYLDAGILRGKTYSEEAARKLLDVGELLTPDTCGWQYVDGLQETPSSHRVAIVWDKIGLGHNSESLPAGGHSVIFMDAFSRVICEADWPRFIEDQQKAWAAIRQGKQPPPVWIPD